MYIFVYINSLTVRNTTANVARPVWALASVGANAGVSGLHAIETISILPGCTHDAGSRRATQAKSWLPGGPDAFVIAFAGDAANLACKVA